VGSVDIIGLDEVQHSEQVRQKSADFFAKESRENFDVYRIQSWFRNYKQKKRRGGEGGQGGGGTVVLKLRDNSHLSDGEN
jgi:hypothetical protein